MPRADTSWTFPGVSRIAVIAVAAALGATALCLVVFGTSQKQLQLGVLLGLWACLIAALVLGARRGQPDDRDPMAEFERAQAQAAELHEAQLKVVALQQEQLEAARQAYFSQEIELRQFGELQLARDASARRESELKLEASLRRELERVMIEQLAPLREEVAALRAEVLDKLGGQLRLERIETTRVIGSDLEALQHEIRRLAAGRPESLAAPTGAIQAHADAPQNIAPQNIAPQNIAPQNIIDAELVEFPPPAATLPPASQQPVPQPPAPQQPVPQQPVFQQPASQQPVPQQPISQQQSGRRRAPDPDQLAAEARYRGRRRADGEPADWLAKLDS
jgi:hypothetical protein